jgi:hypothetical protein
LLLKIAMSSVVGATRSHRHRTESAVSSQLELVCVPPGDAAGWTFIHHAHTTTRR